MDDITLQHQWQQYNAMLEESRVLNMQAWAVNKQTAAMLNKQKAGQKLNKAVWYKALGIAAGVIWQYLLGNLAYFSVTHGLVFQTVFAVGCMAVNVAAIAAYGKQIWLIKQVDNSASLVEAQQTLARLQTSAIQAMRIAFLQLPLWVVVFIPTPMLHSGNIAFWVAQCVTTGLFTYFAIWLYRNIHEKNMDKKWLKVLFNSLSWNATLEAMRFLKEVEDFRQE
jgi:hypothetical protein